jgi:hypothetical protein
MKKEKFTFWNTLLLGWWYYFNKKKMIILDKYIEAGMPIKTAMELTKYTKN